jgi:hypothetical protein
MPVSIPNLICCELRKSAVLGMASPEEDNNDRGSDYAACVFQYQRFPGSRIRCVPRRPVGAIVMGVALEPAVFNRVRDVRIYPESER